MNELKLIIQPDPDEPDAAGVFVDGNVADHEYRFLLDTGAGRSSLVQDQFTQSLRTQGNKETSGVFAPATEELITVPTLECGPIRCRDLVVYRTPARPGAHNLLGMDVLKDHCLHFQFDSERVIVDPDLAGTNVAWQSLHVSRRSHPYVDVVCAGADALAIWDTGASLTVVDTHFIEAHPELFQEAGHSRGTDSTGAQMQTAMYVMGGARIGGHDLAPCRVASVDLSGINQGSDQPITMILGYNILRRADWIFDFPRLQWALTSKAAD